MFAPLFIAILAMLLAVLAEAFYGRGPAAWAIGLAYIAYDTGLQLALLSTAWRAVTAPAITADGPLPSLAVLIPCRNETLVLPATAAAVRGQLLPGDRLLVIDDGSTDGTAAWCREHGVEVLEKPNTGKADSLNRALAVIAEDVVVTVDADTRLCPGALAAMRTAFADPSLAIGGGMLEVSVRAAPFARWLGWQQRAEYLRSFLWRGAWERWGTLLLVSGGFAGYRRTVLAEVGGYAVDSLVEDYEITHRIHRAALAGRRGWRVGMVPGAVAVTDVPAGVRLFLAQRLRWFAGFIRVHLAYRDLVGRPSAGALGMVMLPIKTADLVLPVWGLLAVAILAAFLAFGFTVDPLILWALGGKLLLDLVVGALAVRLSRRWTGRPVPMATILLAIIVEPFGFQPLRQIGALLGWIAHLRRRLTWTPQR